MSNGGFFRIGTVLVMTVVAALDHEDKQYDETDQRYKRDQYPQAAAVGVLQAPDRYG